MKFRSIFTALALSASGLFADNVAGQPFLAIDALNNQVAVWDCVRISDSRYTVQANAYDAVTTQTWGTQTLISDDDFDAYGPVLANNSSGDAVAIWTMVDTTNGVFALAGATYTVAGGWTAPVRISPTDHNVNNYDARMGADGTAWISYNAYHMTEETTTNWSASCSSGTWSSPEVISDPTTP